MLKSHEYSNQLCFFVENFPVGKQLDSVSKWLTTLLMDATSSVPDENEFPIIKKKIRDEICGGNKVDPFQRSSFYMIVKAMLQHSFTMQYKGGPVAGKLFYKIFMLKFLVGTCVPYMKYTSFNIDLLSQAIAKLARRMEKLSCLEIADDLNDLYTHTIGEAKETIRMIREKIDAHIEQAHQKYEQNTKLPILTELNIESDICYESHKLQSYLNKRVHDENLVSTSIGFKSPKFTSYKRHFQHGDMPDPMSIDKIKNPIELRIFWLSFERKILYETEMDNNQLSGEDIRSWSFAYAKYAEENYKNNQVLISRMLLVRLKMIAILDMKATNEHTILKEHSSGIDPEIIKYLLLHHSKDMKIAYDIEEHFRKRNDFADYPGLIEQEEEFSDRSFSCKFVDNDFRFGNSSVIKPILDAIMKADDQCVERKVAEWNELSEKVEQLRNDANSMECEYIVDQNNKITHSSMCGRCKTHQDANDVCIMPYEHRLPENKVDQKAILFELKIPDVIACLRDVLYGFIEYCQDEPHMLYTKFNWNNKFSTFDRSKSEYVKLGSRTKFNDTKAVRVVDSTFETIIVKNTSSCTFHAKNKAMPLFSIDRIKRDCTFNAQGEYSDLQWALSGTEHTENKVLSSVLKYGTDLTLSDYENYGLLRSGHRLQIRKLCDMMANEALSFEKEDVVILIMQTLWQCEQRGECNFVRESHIDFRYKQFCGTMIKRLKIFIDQHRNNWKQPFKLLIATLVAVRAFEINEDETLANEIIELLCHIRKIALQWIKEIKSSIRKMTNSDEIHERSSRLKLIYVAVIGVLTFYVDPKHKFFTNVLENQTAVHLWLRFIICMKNNVRIYTNDKEQLSSNVRMFLRMLESVGVSLEEKIREVIQQDVNIVRIVIKKQWPSINMDNITNIRFNEEFPQIIVAEASVGSTIHTVTIDIITGKFLVDNLPISRLSDKVINSDSYRWFFGDAVFEVQPDVQHNFSTVQTYNNCSYEFKMIENNIIIIEDKATNKKNSLIKVFSMDIFLITW